MSAYPRVFVSSTADLADQRREVAHALMKFGVEPVFSQGSFERSSSILKALEKEIAASDIIVLLVGRKYGATEPQTGKSFTEWEYELAKSLRKPVFAFVERADGANPGNSSTDAEQLARFRARVTDHTLVTLFDAPAELPQLLLRSFAPLAAMGHLEPRKSRTMEALKVVISVAVGILGVVAGFAGSLSSLADWGSPTKIIVALLVALAVVAGLNTSLNPRK